MQESTTLYREVTAAQTPLALPSQKGMAARIDSRIMRYARAFKFCPVPIWTNLVHQDGLGACGKTNTPSDYVGSSSSIIRTLTDFYLTDSRVELCCKD